MNIKLYIDFRYILHLTIVVTLLIFFLEGVSFLINRHNKIEKPFLIDYYVLLGKAETRWELYNEIDPLLGWSMSENEIRNRGFVVKNNCIYLEGKKPNALPMKIVITGGSTTDLICYNDNWPYHLHKLLEQKGISHEIYIGSVGGYSSGQELFKTIRDILSIKPDIHISYSGANECFNSSYETTYLYDIIYTFLNSKSLFLPNTIFLIKSKMLDKKQTVTLKRKVTFNTAEYWYSNTQILDAIALKYGYQFYSVIQPVKGVGKRVDGDENRYSNYVDCYRSTYKDMLNTIQKKPNGCYLDFTGIFDTINEVVFSDDCHLHSKFQPIVAQAIIDKIISKDIKPLIEQSQIK